MTAAPSTRGKTDRETASLARGASVNLVGSVARSVFSGLILFLLSRGLGAGRAGAFIEATALFQILCSAGSLGVQVGFIRSISRAIAVRLGRVAARRILPVGLLPILVLSVGLAVALGLTATPVAEVIGNGERVDEIAAYLRGLAWFLPFGAVNLAVLGATRGFEAMTPTVALDQVMKLGLQCLGVVVAISMGASPSLLVAAWGVPVVLSVLGGSEWLRRLWPRLEHGSEPATDDVLERRRRVTAFTLRDEIVDFWGFTLPRSAANIFQTLVQWFDVLLVGGFISPEAAAIYAVSTRLVSFGLAIGLALGTVTQPMLGRMLALGDRDRVRHLFETSTSWQILLTWPQYIVVAIVSPALLGLFGPEFATGVPVVVILAIAAMLASACGPVDMVLLMAGKSVWSLWNTAIALGANIALNLLLIPRFGITGAALAWGTSRLIANFVPMFQTSRYLGYHPFGTRWGRAVLLSLLAFVGPGALVLALGRADQLWAALAYGLAASAVFVPLVYRSRDRLELGMIGAAVSRRLGRSPARTGAGGGPRRTGDEA